MSVFRPLTLDDLETGGYDTVIVCAPDMAGPDHHQYVWAEQRFDQDVDRATAHARIAFVRIGQPVAARAGLPVQNRFTRKGEHAAFHRPTPNRPTQQCAGRIDEHL